MNATAEIAGARLEDQTRFALPTLFISSAIAILAVTGLAKLWSSFGHTKLLAIVDPIMGISFGRLMLAVGVLELVIAGICPFCKSQTLKLGLIAWLATNSVLYRLGVWWMGWKKPCSCLGNLTDPLHLSPQVSDNIMKVFLAYLLIGSYGLLIWQWKTQKRNPPPHKAAEDAAGSRGVAETGEWASTPNPRSLSPVEVERDPLPHGKKTPEVQVSDSRCCFAVQGR